MKLERYRPFNTADGHAGRSKPGIDASSVVKAGNRIFMSGQTGQQIGGAMPAECSPAALAERAMASVSELLAEAGAGLDAICKVTTWLSDRAYRPAAYNVVGTHLAKHPTVATGLVARGLGLANMKLNLGIEAVIPGPGGHEKFRTFDTGNWFGQSKIARQSCMTINTGDEIYLRGQAGTELDGSKQYGPGFTPKDAAEQADVAIQNARTLLEEAGASFADVCQLHVYIRDRAYREAIYQVMGKHLAETAPVSTGLIVRGYARLPILFEIDMSVTLCKGTPHTRLRTFETTQQYKDGQDLRSRFSMAVRAGDRVYLRGQTGLTFDGGFTGHGDAAAQAEQAMKNVAVLLDEAGAGAGDICKLTVYLTDREFLEDVEAVIARQLGDVRPCYTVIVIDGLAMPWMLVEIDIDAVIHD
ncbi:MAG: Rid family hydrolase [Proteobacteria bacterium]|nr:Rid family hydrolase [Pseudomonadota bacterium]